MVGFANSALSITGRSNLCLAGGVALNCVGNGKILQNVPNLKNLWIQPASGDAGGALGCALNYYYGVKKFERKVKPKTCDFMSGSFLGSSSSEEEINKMIKDYGAVFEVMDYDVLNKKIAKFINEGKVIGWHQGRSEFGPRALGNRSIIGDPRNAEMQSKMNLKIKFEKVFDHLHLPF